MNSYFTRLRLLFVCLHRDCVHAAAASDECTAINPSKADAANERSSPDDLLLLRAHRFKAITVSAQLLALITTPAPRRYRVEAVPEPRILTRTRSRAANKAMRHVGARPATTLLHFHHSLHLGLLIHIPLPLNCLSNLIQTQLLDRQ